MKILFVKMLLQSQKRGIIAKLPEIFDAALPVELSRAEQIDLVRNFCNQCFVSCGMCVDFAFHDKNDGNPHVHILLTTRHVDNTGFTTTDRSWNDKDLFKLCKNAGRTGAIISCILFQTKKLIAAVMQSRI